MRPHPRHLQLLALVATLVVAATPRADAQVIHDNGLPDNRNGIAVDFGITTANDFTLGATTTLGSFDWYVLHFGTTSGPSTIASTFFWSILSDASGSPSTAGAPLASGTVTNATGTLTAFGCCGGFQAYLLNASLGNLALGAGTYWLSIGNYSSTYVSQPNRGNYWATSAQQGNAHIIEDGFTSDIGFENAFAIQQGVSTVPEPATLVLLASGLAGLGGVRARLRRKRD